MKKEIKGYKLKQNCLKYAKVCDLITKGWWNNYADRNLQDNGWNFLKEVHRGDGIESYFINCNLLDEWFECVYEEVDFNIGDWVVWVLSGHVAQIKSRCTEYPDSWNLRADGVDDGEYSSCYEGNLRAATPEEIKVALKPKMIVNGLNVEFYNNYITIGTFEINKETFIKLFDTLMLLTDIGSNTLGNINIDKITFTENQIIEIANYYIKTSKIK